jgi:hypothetical protein
MLAKQQGEAGYVLCDLHAPKATPMVSAARKEAPALDAQELHNSTRSVKDKMALAKQSMEAKGGGESLPLCSRCGMVIEKHQDILSSGMQRFHAVCPSKEEASVATRSTRYFLKKTPERLVLLLTCDADKKEKYSFMYEVEHNSLALGLRQNNYEPCELVFRPDVKARASMSRKLVVPASRAFDVSVREYHTFSFIDPRDASVTSAPLVRDQRLTVVKYFLTNGVLFTLEAVFTYDEASFAVGPESVRVCFAMYPPRAAEPPRSPGALASRTRSVFNPEKILKDFSVV